MKSIVTKPHAMKAAMLGMIIPDRNVPTFCTATLVPAFPPAGAAVVALTCSPPAGRISGCSGPATAGPISCVSADHPEGVQVRASRSARRDQRHVSR